MWTPCFCHSRSPPVALGDASWDKDEGFLLKAGSQAKPSVESGLLETQDAIAEVATETPDFPGNLIRGNMESLVEHAASLKHQT